MKYFLLFSLLANSSLAYSAPDTLTLETVVQETLQKSPEVIKARSAAKEASWKKFESFGGFLPTVTVGANYLTDKRYMLINTQINGGPVVFPSIVPTANYTANATLPIFDGFASTNRYRSGIRLSNAAEKQRDWTEFSTQRQIILLFYKSLAAENLKEVAEQNLSTLRDHQKDALALKKAGVTTQYDVLRTETQLSEAESEILNTTDNVEISKFKLGEALGKEKEERALSGKLPVLNPELISKLREEQISSRGDIQALSLRAESLDFTDRAEGRFWVPMVSLFGQYQHYNNIDTSIWDNHIFRDAYQVGINMTWNIFDGGHSIARSRQVTEQNAQLQTSLHQARLKARQDFEFWKRKFLYFCAVYKARNADITRSNEAVRLARAGRRVGARTTTELLDAELDLFRARSGLVNAQVGSAEALIQLELASGEKLYDFN